MNRYQRVFGIVCLVVLSIAFFTCRDIGESASPAVIDIKAIPGIVVPTYGGTPVTSILDTGQYTGTVSWSPSDSFFCAETVYTAFILLTAKTGYTLTGVSADFFTLDGAVSVTNDADSGEVTAIFPGTEASDFSYQQVHSVGTQGHALGDMNGDGYLDVILAEGEFSDNLIFAWLEYPDWTVHDIDLTFLSSTMDYIPDLQAVDLDDDGDTDIILPNSHNSDEKSLWWWENDGSGTSFTKHLIYSAYDNHIKDINLSDFDQDGKLDIVLRYTNLVRFFYQNNAQSDDWQYDNSQSVTGSEGLGVGDVNGDSFPDVVHNGTWLKNPGNRTGSWTAYTIDSSAPDDSRVAIGDIDGDGLADPVVGNSEGEGPIKWYKRDSDSSWTATTIQTDLNGSHTMQIADMDLDGDNDIISGTLHSSTPGLAVYLNGDSGTTWNQKVVQSVTSYIGKVGDIDANGAPDIMTSRHYSYGPMEVWFNQ